MDANAHSTSFGTTNNKRGEQVDDFIARHKLNIENTGVTPTFQARGAATIVDITLTARLAVNISHWSVSQEYNGSDHNTITFIAETDKHTIEPTWKWHKADWQKFTAQLQKSKLKIPSQLTQTTCEWVLGKLYKEIDDAMTAHIPKTKPKIIDRNNPWWITPGGLTHYKQKGKYYVSYTKNT